MSQVRVAATPGNRVMTRTRMLAVASILMLISGMVQGKEVLGIEMPDTLETGGQQLSLNGGGARTRLVVRVYVAGLYLAGPSSDAAAIIAADEPMAIRLHVTSGLLTAKRMREALVKGFNKSTDGNQASVQTGIDQLSSLLSEDISKRDTLTLAYTPGVGTEVRRNDKPLETIAGLAFKQALFGIWLGDKPAQDNLKAGMLGQ